MCVIVSVSLAVLLLGSARVTADVWWPPFPFWLPRVGAAVGLVVVSVEVRHGVRIHTGEVVLGEVGIAVHSDFTAVGDTVNTASRLEAMTTSHRADTILSAETARRLTEADFSLTSLRTTEVRGRSEPVEIFGLR